MNLPRRLNSRCWGSCCSYIPFVDACQTSTEAFLTGLPVSADVTVPCRKATTPSLGVSNVMVLPLSRMGVSARQKGPRMAEDVPVSPFLAAAR